MRDFKKTVAENIAQQSLEWLTSRTNRSIGQTLFLWEILGDWKLLLELEEAIKVFQYGGGPCPSDFGEAAYLIGKLRTWKRLKWIPKVNEYTFIKQEIIWEDWP